jgi:threonine dehydratase
MLARCIDRALFLRGSRVGLNLVLPYGTTHLVALLKIIPGRHAEVISCVSVSQVDTVANRERDSVIIDVASPETLKGIEEDCTARG